MKQVRTPGYNYNFNGKIGRFVRWGYRWNDDPQWSPIGPEILDIEVSKVCRGGCKFCYKNNTAIGENMSISTFQAIIDKMPMLTQIAIGIGDIDANPDLWKMMEYARSRGIVPNITINGYRMSADKYDLLARYCGAVAVSLYDKDSTYNAVKELTDRGMTQVNIHALVSDETLERCYELVWDVKQDPRLSGLNAVVFLSLKQRGRGEGYTPLSKDKYEKLMRFAVDNIRCGFDSCSANKFLEGLKDHPNYQKLEMSAEPCESGLFSAYVNVEGKYFPCSFSENGDGLDVVNCQDFLEDIWYHPKTIAWRRSLIEAKRNCPLYQI